MVLYLLLTQGVGSQALRPVPYPGDLTLPSTRWVRSAALRPVPYSGDLTLPSTPWVRSAAHFTEQETEKMSLRSPSVYVAESGFKPRAAQPQSLWSSHAFTHFLLFSRQVVTDSL